MAVYQYGFDDDIGQAYAGLLQSYHSGDMSAGVVLEMLTSTGSYAGCYASDVYGESKRRQSSLKYELTDETCIIDGVTLHRIRALRDIPGTSVKAGDLGGWIQWGDNLSQDGSAWIYDEGAVYERATVCDGAYVCDNARVFGWAKICEHAHVVGNAQVFGASIVKYHASIRDNAKVYDHAVIDGAADIRDNAEVYGDAKIGGYGGAHGDEKRSH